MKKNILSSFLLSLLLFVSCNTTEPTIENKPGSRNYSWTIDTLSSGSLQTYMVSMWGSSSEDVWICGYDANNAKCIYHFNGTDWARIYINVPNHTVDPLALFWGVWADGKEVFIADTENGIIYLCR